MQRPTLDEIFSEPDEFGLLDVEIRPRETRSPQAMRDVETVRDVNVFYERTGRLPDADAQDHDEMRLGVIWRRTRSRATASMRSADRNRLIDRPPSEISEVTTSRNEPDWREAAAAEDVPASLDDIFLEDDEELAGAFVDIRHVTPAAQRQAIEHRAEMRPCVDFETFRPMFEEMQAALTDGEREASVIEARTVIELQEGDLFIRKGLLAYIAEKTEMSSRRGKRDQRLRVVFSNGTESDLLLSSFRKSLAEDPTARIVHRPGLGPLDPEWDADRLELTGTVYVARSRSEEPSVARVRTILHKIGVTSQNVRRRVADARNDPTFLMAPVDVVATYELKNLSRRKIELLLHRFFDAARPRDLWTLDRFGRRVFPREWFYVLPEHIGQAARLIQNGTLHLYRYDPERQEIVANEDL